MKMKGSVLEEKSSFKMLGLTFFSKLDWGCYTISIAKTVSKKIGALIHSMNFFSPQVAVYLYKSTIRPCMEYCSRIWAGAPSCCFELLDNLLLLLNAWLIVRMWLAYVFSIVITLVDVLQNWLNWFHFPFFEGVLLIILIHCMIFLSPFLDVTKISMSTVSFLAQ